VGIMADSGLIPADKYEEISLGDLDQSRFTLIYGMLVGAIDKKFIFGTKLPGLRFIQKDVLNISVTILWTYLTTGTHPSFLTSYTRRVKIYANVRPLCIALV
jgi:hypothetical protein